MTVQPFVIHATGRAEVGHLAERAVIRVAVTSKSENKASVSDEVITTAKHIEKSLRDLYPKDDSLEAKQSAAVAHWSKTSLSATSFIPWASGAPKSKQHNVRIDFDIRFKDFKALGSSGTKISALPHVEIQGLSWILTAATAASYNSRLRKEAARDALLKAQDFCEVLGCHHIRPIDLTEDGTAKDSSMSGSMLGMANMGNQVSYQQSAPGVQPQPLAPGVPGAFPPHDYRNESSLEFRPEEVRMNKTVAVRFHAE